LTATCCTSTPRPSSARRRKGRARWARTTSRWARVTHTNLLPQLTPPPLPLQLKLDSITLELTLEELNEKTAKIEDLPGLFVFIVEMAAFPESISWVSAATGVFSGVMLGRKFSGGAKREELIAKKREIEEEMETLGGGRRLSLGGTLRGVESVFGAAAAREMEAEIEDVVGEGEGTGDLEMASVETRPVELPGAVGGEGAGGEGGGGGSLRVQLEQALRREEALRVGKEELLERAAAEAERADKAEQENGVLRRRVRGAEGEERGGE
jgi:hypothetical protein